MTKRKAISKRVRFEVFKRDSFTCQYCGEKAPDVILHVDHIRPVADGGENDILNLVTACESCNSGKGARKLDDRSAVVRQRAQIEELVARREQLEMMLQWRDEAEKQKTDLVEEVASRLVERGGFGPNENGRAHIRRWLKRFTIAEILAALDESFDHYMRWSEDEPNQGAWNTAFNKTPAIASLHKQAADKPYIPKLAYIQGILRRRFGTPRINYMVALEEFHTEDDVPIGWMEEAAKKAADWADYCNAMDAAFVASVRGEDGQD
jgi:hypothetical protein